MREIRQAQPLMGTGGREMTFKCHYKNCAEEDDQYAKTGASIDGKYYCEAHYNDILDKAEAKAIADLT